MILTPDKYQKSIDYADATKAQVNHITRKLFNLLGLNHFAALHFENKSKSAMAGLLTNISLPTFWVENDMPIPSTLPNGFYLVSQYKELFSEHLLTTIREKYAMDNFLFYIQHNRDSTDIYGIGADPDNKKILSNYINHAHTIRKFFLYFKQETKGLLQEAVNRSCDYDFNVALQKKAAPGESQTINYNGFSSLHDIADALSKREFQCLEALATAMSIKSIAKKLKLAPRTVESYLINVKNKLNCTNRSEALDLYHTLNNETGELL